MVSVVNKVILYVKIFPFIFFEGCYLGKLNVHIDMKYMVYGQWLFFFYSRGVSQTFPT